MRIRISHLTRYSYGTPATSVIQMLRLTPRNHDGQYVARWRIDVSTDCRLDQHEDAFGNLTHAFSTEGPFSELAVMVDTFRPLELGEAGLAVEDPAYAWTWAGRQL